MISLDDAHPTNAGINAMSRDGSSAGESHFARPVARCVAGLLRALHESRRRQGEREIARYRHLICGSDDGAFERKLVPDLIRDGRPVRRRECNGP
jgi:hypothetical protein